MSVESHLLCMIIVSCFLLMLNIVTNFGVSDSECAALKDFYYGTNGDGWINNGNWAFVKNTSTLTCNDVCNDIVPYGLSCETHSVTTTPHVTEINFNQENNLNGTIPSTIKNLANLKIFTLNNQTNLFGYLPLFSIKSLNILALSNMENLTVILELMCNATSLIYLTIENVRVSNLANMIVNDNQLNGTLPNCFDKLTNLGVLTIQNVNSLIGSIPTSLMQATYKLSQITMYNTSMKSSLPNEINLPYLRNLYMQGIDNNHMLYGTIPVAICNIGTRANLSGGCLLMNLSNNDLQGTIPRCLFENMIFLDIPLQQYYLSRNRLNGTIDDINIQNFTKQVKCRNLECETVLDLSFNNIIGNIPLWMTQCFWETLFLNNNQLNGTIPNNWTVATGFDLSNNDLHGTIAPKFFFDGIRTTSFTLDLSNNKLNGIIPLNVIKHTRYLILNNNKFEYIDLCYNASIVSLIAITLHNNNIKHDNIGNDINCLLRNNDKLMYLTLYNNPNIKGNINNLQINRNNTVSPWYFQYLALHNCDISGKLPPSMNLYNLSYFSIYNNRLSCSVPYTPATNDHIDKHGSHNYLLLLGNMFDYNNKKNGWLSINSDVSKFFVKATNLYLTDNDQIILNILVVLSLVCICCAAIYRIMTIFCDKIVKRLTVTLLPKNDSNKLLPTKYKNDDTYNNLLFLSFLKHMVDATSNYLIIPIVGALIIFYYFLSSYYDCGRITSHFTLAYIELDFNNNSISQWLCQLFIIWVFIIFNANMFYYLSWLNKMQLKKREKNNFNDNVNGRTCGNVFMCVLYWIIYLVSIILCILYIATSSLPRDNVLNINNAYQQISLHYLLGIVLTITIVYIVPKVSDYMTSMQCCNCICNYNSKSKGYIIFYLRSMLSILIPFVTSVLFLNDCLGFWSLLWNPCLEQNNNSIFNIQSTFQISYDINIDITITYSTQNDICHTNNINVNNIHGINQCLRSFWDIWIPIVTIKLLLFIVNPWIMLLVFKYKCKRKCMKSNMDTESSVVGSRYAVLATKFEIFVYFGFVAPHVLFVISIGLISNFLAHGLIYVKSRQWNIQVNYGTFYFPFKAIILSILLQQVVLVLFLIDIFTLSGIYVLVSLLIVINGASVYTYKKSQAKAINRERVSIGNRNNGAANG